MTEEGKNRICLNMIVKNESRIIRRLLESVVDLLDLLAHRQFARTALGLERRLDVGSIDVWPQIAKLAATVDDR